MYSLKDTLSEQFVIHGSINTEHSKIDNKLITENISKDLEKMVFDHPNYTYDIKINYHAQHSWVFSLINEKINLDHNLPIQNSEAWANVEGCNEISVKRNNLDLNKIEGAPHYTLIYIINAGVNSGELILDYNTQHMKQKIHRLPIETGNFYLFNSNIDYYLSKNYDEENRVSMTWTCFKR